MAQTLIGTGCRLLAWLGIQLLLLHPPISTFSPPGAALLGRTKNLLWTKSVRIRSPYLYNEPLCRDIKVIAVGAFGRLYVFSLIPFFHQFTYSALTKLIPMGKFLEEIPEYLAEWILQQQMFWVASAPLSPDGHVNISPKAIEDTFHVVNSRRVWYEDLSGTGMCHVGALESPLTLRG